MASAYRIFLKGLLTLLPITLTLYLLVWITSVTEDFFGSWLQGQFPQIFGFPGSGVLIGMTLVFVVGLAVNSYMTQRFVEWFDERLENLPVIRTIYGPLRDVTNLFASQSHSNQRVVLVQLDDRGVEVLGLITRDKFGDLPAGTVKPESVAVFVPFSYGMGGFTIVVPKTRVRETTLPADRAMQLAITGWIKSSK